jgi:hypothetical protein
MRITKFIFKSIIFLIVVGGVSFLLARETLMFIGIGKVKSSLSTLRSASVQKNYFAKCREKGTVFIDGDDPAVMQLRFTSTNEYVLEILCSQFSIDPILIEKEQLPMFVKKAAGNSGIIWGDIRSGIVLEIFNRQKSIGVEGRAVTTFSADSELGIGPITSCAGYGFSCCRYESEQGFGEQFNNSVDCPKTCFSSCVSRPIVLAFNTQPFLDLEKRFVTISAGESVTFSFVVDAGLDNSVKVKLDYGDGKTDAFYVDKQTTTHAYQCSKQECSYQVKLVVEDEAGISAVDLPIMNMVVLVKG